MELLLSYFDFVKNKNLLGNTKEKIMWNFLLNISLGMLPEVLYFTVFIIYVKDIKEKRGWLFLSILISYVTCVMVLRYTLLFYFAFIFMMSGFLKMLYKESVDIIDVLVVAISTVYLTVVSTISYIFIKNDNSNYWLFYIIARVLLFLQFVFKKQYNKLYKKVRCYWNRNREREQGIKSISVRNISVMIIVILIALVNAGISIKINGG